MNAFWLIGLLLVERFFLLGLLNKEALTQAQHFAPMKDQEKIAYWIYQVCTLIIIIMPAFLRVNLVSTWSYLGLISYIVGVIGLTLSIHAFARQQNSGLNTTGIYHFSRHPMYMSYFFSYLGIGFLSQSLNYIIIVLVFQIAAHWIILAEERWCIQQFGDQYIDYTKKVRRYL